MSTKQDHVSTARHECVLLPGPAACFKDQISQQESYCLKNDDFVVSTGRVLYQFRDIHLNTENVVQCADTYMYATKVELVSQKIL